MCFYIMSDWSKTCLRVRARRVCIAFQILWCTWLNIYTSQTPKQSWLAGSKKEIVRLEEWKAGKSVPNPRNLLSINSMQRQSPWQHSSPRCKLLSLSAPLLLCFSTRYRGTRWALWYGFCDRVSTGGALQLSIHFLSVFCCSISYCASLRLWVQKVCISFY